MRITVPPIPYLSSSTAPPPLTPLIPSTPGANGGNGNGTGNGGTAKKNKFRRSWSHQTQKKTDYNFSTENDIHGIVMLEIQGATDLPRLKNSELAFAFPLSRAGTDTVRSSQ